MGKNATLSDVARLAGVSVATASRVLSGGAPVRRELCERVQGAVSDLRYVTNASGRDLATGRSSVEIGVVVGGSTTMHPNAVLRVVDEEIRSRGGSARFCFGHPKPTMTQVQSARRFLCVDASPVAALACRSAGRTVTLDSGFGLADIRGVSLADCLELALSYLRSLGHVRIGLIGSPGIVDQLPDHVSALAGIEVGIAVQLSAAGGRTAMAHLLQSPAPPSAVFCTSDALAAGAIGACLEMGLGVPANVSVLGCGDFAAQLTAPSLSTVRWNVAEAARAAVRVLMDVTELRIASNQYAPPKIVVRGTTGPAGVPRETCVRSVPRET